MNRTERAQRRRRMQYKIRETVALRRFTATFAQRPEAPSEGHRVPDRPPSTEA